MKASYKEAADALDHAGIEHIVIKGFAQAPEYVKDARLRAQSDIDLYCPAEKIKSAQIALQSIGYVPNKEVDYSRADHAPTMVRTGNWKWQGNPFDPEMPLSIELHFCLWNEATCLFPIRGVDAFWDRRIKRVVEELSFPSLSPLDQLGYFALHILRNVLPNQWVIHHVRELAVFLHSHATDDAFWKDWSETHDPSCGSWRPSPSTTPTPGLIADSINRSRMRSRTSHLCNSGGCIVSPDPLSRSCFIRTRIQSGCT